MPSPFAEGGVDRWQTIPLCPRAGEQKTLQDSVKLKIRVNKYNHLRDKCKNMPGVNAMGRLECCQNAIYHILFEDGVALYENAVTFAMYWPHSDKERGGEGPPTVVALASHKARLVLELISLGRSIENGDRLPDLEACSAGLRVLEKLFRDDGVVRVACSSDQWQAAEKRLAPLHLNWAYCEPLTVRRASPQRRLPCCSSPACLDAVRQRRCSACSMRAACVRRLRPV